MADARPITARQRAALASLLVASMTRPRHTWDWRAHDGKTFALPTIAALRKRELVAVTAGKQQLSAALTAKGLRLAQEIANAA